MARSLERVEQAARSAGLDINVVHMPSSTRTAEDAATACDVEVGQIVKSLVFEGAKSGKLVLLLVSGQNQVDMNCARSALKEPLVRADAKRVRQQTGFAIGGVAPIGHLTTVDVWMDETLLSYGTVWAAAGAPNAVFEVEPRKLQRVTGAQVTKLC